MAARSAAANFARNSQKLPSLPAEPLPRRASQTAGRPAEQQTKEQASEQADKRARRWPSAQTMRAQVARQAAGQCVVVWAGSGSWPLARTSSSLSDSLALQPARLCDPIQVCWLAGCLAGWPAGLQSPRAGQLQRRRRRMALGHLVRLSASAASSPVARQAALGPLELARAGCRWKAGLPAGRLKEREREREAAARRSARANSTSGRLALGCAGARPCTRGCTCAPRAIK